MMSTYVILLHGELHELPKQIIGPFTYAQALRVSRTLTCTHLVCKINTVVPEWARCDTTARADSVKP